ncbi:MAG: beta-galactosidase [Luteolibacter sp.]
MFRNLPLAALCTLALSAGLHAAPPQHTFSVGQTDFLLDEKPIVIRCGEIHSARVPHEYWRNRLQSMHAMGLNTVCAYLFWNFHEFKQGTYNWEGQADVAEFCKIAQEEGLWVILRPGPYACAEWDGGGIPWWLLKNPDIKLRTQDPDFIKAAVAWFKEVGRVLGPMQVTRGGPILMAQVENEYGSYGKDAEYMGKMRQAMIDGGFDIPLFACNPAGDLKKGYRDDLFQVVNFGSDAPNGFKKLREVLPTGPLMCGEFYPGWFDTWGAPHHLGKTDQYLKDLGYMLENRGSFSIYMAHGGTSFGLWSGADRPFKPDTSSYDYDAPISEAGWIGEKFKLTRELMSKHLEPGEKLPDPPAPLPVMSLPSFTLTQTAPIFANLPAPISDTTPRNMEAYDQGHGMTVYRTTLPAGPAGKLQVEQANDFAWVFVDGKQAGIMDRRSRRFSVQLPAREKPAQLDILVEAVGHVNFGLEIHDRKGIRGPVRLGETTLEGAWQVYTLSLDAPMIAGLKWKPATEKSTKGPSFWRGSFTVSNPADTFLDLSNWGKGVLWVNGHCLARYWNIGPTQTAYLPGAWLKKGANEIIILDLLEPTSPQVSGLEKPILDKLRPELDFAKNSGPASTTKLSLTGVKPVYKGEFKPGGEPQEVKFPQPASGSQFCIEALSAQDGKNFAAIAELDLLDPAGNPISHQAWTIAYASSQEQAGEDGSASNAIDGQTSNFWHSQWKNKEDKFPHRIVIDLGKVTKIGGLRYTPRAGDANPGRIKDYQIYVGDGLAR